MRAGETITIAPREVQQTHKLLNTGWALATTDYQRSGLVPINHLRRNKGKNAKNQSYQSNDSDQIVMDDVIDMPLLDLASMGIGNVDTVPVENIGIPQSISVVKDSKPDSDKKLQNGAVDSLE